MSESYLEEDYAEPAGGEVDDLAREPTRLDADTLERMVDWAVEERLGREGAIDEWEADYEQRQAADDAVAAQEQDEAQLDADAEREALMHFTEAVQAAGIRDPRVAVDAWEAMNGLMLDPDFVRRYRGNELIDAAIYGGIRLAHPEPGEDEVAAAERIMAGRQARARMTAHRAGVPDRSGEEMVLAAVAETVGATRAEVAEARRMLKMTGEP